MMKKTFDCVEMKRIGAEYVHGVIKNMSPEQEVEFWRKRTEEFRQEQAAIRAKPMEQAHAPANT